MSEANFNKARFKNKVYFIESKFFDAIFKDSRFFLDAYFYKTIFNSANFTSVIFYTKAIFDEAKFLGKTSFELVNFKHEASFKRTVFNPHIATKCIDPLNFVSFRNCLFEKQERVIFEECNMERVSFIGTPVNKCLFNNVKWKDFKVYDETLLMLRHSKNAKTKFKKECKEKLSKELKILEKCKNKNLHYNKELKTLLELKSFSSRAQEFKKIKKISIETAKFIKEIELAFPQKAENELINEIKNTLKNITINFDNVEKDDKLTLENVLSIYRNLRDNYDYYLKYDDSGRFFVNEMKLKRKFSNKIEKIVMSIYELLCLYGESFERTIFWIIASILSFAFIRLLLVLTVSALNENISIYFLTFIINAFINYLKTSVLVFFQLYYDSRWLTIIERLISIPILGSFYIALRRKLERKIRH